jgi:hypothetical protein
MSENVFVESYHKELARTGYPFDRALPVQTDSGYTVPAGSILDASIYTESAASAPRLDKIIKDKLTIQFYVGDFVGIFYFETLNTIVEFYSESGLFGGILVVSPARLQQIGGWPDGEHNIFSDARFCLRCVEILPSVGVTRFVADDGNSVSGNVVFAAGTGGLLRLLTAETGVTYVEINYIGEPTFPIRETEESVPITTLQSISYNVSSRQEGSEEPETVQVITVYPDQYGAISLIPRNVTISNLEQDPLRINAADNVLKMSLGGA